MHSLSAEEDAELALQAVGLVMRDIQWAEI
jgi:hypothetical protein